jgi:hypothetical protein
LLTCFDKKKLDYRSEGLESTKLHCNFPWNGMDGSFPAPGCILVSLTTIFFEFKLPWLGRIIIMCAYYQAVQNSKKHIAGNG